MKNEIPKKQESLEEALKRLEHVTITPEESALMFDTHLGLIIRSARPVNLPFMFILGGQAGAGKTYMEYASVEQSDKNRVVINLDNFKELHPAYPVLKKEDPAVIHKILGDDVRIWTKKAIKYCLDKKLNFSIESTLRGGPADPVINLMKEAQNKGFSVELKMMSVSPELSSLGIKERKEEQIIKSPERYGRDVSLASHEAMVKNIPATLRSIENIKCFDNITIYSRKINVYDERLYEPFLSAINPPSLRYAHQLALDRLLSTNEKRNYNDRLDSVKKQMKARGATLNEFNEIDRYVKPMDVTALLNKNFLRHP